MPLKAGYKSLNPLSANEDYTGSMAEAIEIAFGEVYRALNPGKKAPEPNDQTRILYLAIANGVINHLNANASSFSLTATIGPDTFTGQVTGIDIVKNPYND